MILVKNLKFCERFVLSKIHPEKVFGDVLVLLCLSKIDREKVFAEVPDKKEAFKDYKNNRVRKT